MLLFANCGSVCCNRRKIKSNNAGVKGTFEVIKKSTYCISKSNMALTPAVGIEYAIPWRHYARDLDKLLQANFDAKLEAYNNYVSFYFSAKRELQLLIFRPCCHARAEIEMDEDTVYRKLLSARNGLVPKK